MVTCSRSEVALQPSLRYAMWVTSAGGVVAYVNSRVKGSAG
jgi:hypothetical protein